VVNRVNQRDKIVAFDDLPRIRERHRGETIVHCHGAFDLVHMGHLIHFEEARAQGDLLVVTITADRHITKKRTVSFSEEYRARQVAALEIVDYVALVQEPTALSAIEALHPDVYVKGPEYADLMLDKSRSIFHEMRVLESYGGRIYFTAGDTFSSTKLSHFLLASPDAAQRNPLLRNDRVLFRDVSTLGFKLDQLKRFVAQAHKLRVCVVGETIVDEWVDVSLTNLSTQSRCVAGQEVARVRQVGGVGIIARHLATFVESVDCFTNDAPDAEARDHGAPNIKVTPVGRGQLVETRFVDRGSGHPVFKLKNHGIADVRPEVLPDFDDYDLVLVADFGHGLLDAASLNARIARRRKAFVSAMAQVNSSNYGYNLPMKYIGADYYCLNRTEAELSLHERNLPLPELVERSSRLLGAANVAVTDGGEGVALRMADARFTLPSLSVGSENTSSSIRVIVPWLPSVTDSRRQ